MKVAILAKTWNSLVGLLRSQRLNPGTYCRISQTAKGSSISGTVDYLIKHPWFTTVSFNGDNWVAKVNPGFVNGIDPTVSALDEKTGKQIALGLLSSLALTLYTFADRTASDSKLTIPPYFKDQGATKDVSFSADENTGEIQFKDNPKGRRMLASADVYISVARIAVNGSVSIVDGSGAGGEIAQYNPVFDTSALKRYGSRPRLMATGNLQEQQDLTNAQRLLGILTGNAPTDIPADDRLVATIFFLSPPDFDGGVDDSWTPFVQHHLFYNLNYAPQNLMPIATQAPKPITIFTGLAGGYGDIIANQMLAPINDAASLLGAGLKPISQSGMFWTI